MFQRPYSPDKIYQVLSFYIPYQHILNYLRTITLAYIFLYRTSAHYKSDALLRTARASCSTPASAYITLINRNTNRRPVVRFTTPRPDHPSARLADSAVINFSITVVIINSMADNFWPNTSGDIHLKYILLVHIIFVKEQFIFALVCNIVCRTIIHYKRGLYHGYEARAGNVLPGVRPCHITR